MAYISDIPNNVDPIFPTKVQISKSLEQVIIV